LPATPLRFANGLHSGIVATYQDQAWKKPEPGLVDITQRPGGESRRLEQQGEQELAAILIVAAVLAGGLALFLWRGGRGTRIAAGLGGLAVACVAAAWVMRPAAPDGAGGSTDAWLVDSAMAFNKPGMPAMPGTNTAAAQAGSLPELAGRLAARLANSPEDAGGWSLLAVTYRQLGREAEAAAAEQRAIGAGADPETFSKVHPFAMAAAGDAAGPATSMTTQAAGAPYVIAGQRLKIQRKFREAQAQFRKAVEADPRDADSWADLADCAAAAAGNDLTAGRDAVAQALAINPRHRKALWLRASLELQQQRYAAAAATWQTLSGLVAAGSPDARVIAANLAEANALAASTGG
jgi:cytochrome c-type biogenesis protein CcmH/NrfG